MSSGRSSSGLSAPRDRDQVLPGQRDGIVRLEAPGESEVVHPVGLLGTAAELPSRLPQRDRNAGLGLELLQVRLARAVRIRLGERELGVQVEQRRRHCAGAVVSPLSSRLTPAGLKRSSVLMPPMRLAEASKPSGGRLNALCSR